MAKKMISACVPHSGAGNICWQRMFTSRIMAAFERTEANVEAAPASAPPRLEEVEWEHLQKVLTDAGGNISEAARRLGMHRRSLQRKLARGRPGPEDERDDRAQPDERDE